MKETIDMMAQLLEKYNIPLPEGARKKDGGSSSNNKERCHALVVGSSRYYSFIIDLGDSRHMDSMQDSSLTLYPSTGPSILMGEYSKNQAKGIGRIDLEDGYFNNVLFVPDLEANLLSLYQITHIDESKRLTFTPDIVEVV